MIRSFDARSFPPEAVATAKAGRTVTVCLPARDEEATVGTIVARVHETLVRRHAVVDELLVVDDGSGDATAARAAAAGARVLSAAELVPTGASPGKGQAMWAGLQASSGDIVAFCDADVREFDPAFVLGLVGPLLADDGLGFVKGFYDRPVEGRDGRGGRVTELTARPLIAALFPHLAALRQPLAGECAGRREVLEAVPFVGGYGVDLGLVIDVAARLGTARIAQCDLGRRIHRNRSLDELGAQALAVVQVALQRGGARGAEALPWTSALQRASGEVVPVTMTELPPQRSLGGRRTA
ncbi:MAG TPA: glucosyl-3-phosphoglycerate synthase [Acidimicrobiales bacterium]|nr:glucosyl-3-phosphoglycerate synthase [Acidimicrobiales bacterium]